MTDDAAAPQGAAELRRAPSRGGPRDGARPVLALDLGGTQIRAAAVDIDGMVLARQHRPTPVADGPAAVVAACGDALREARAELTATAPALAAALVGVGVSAPGPLDPWRGVIIEPPNIGPAFRNVPLGERLEDALGLPVFVERDTNVAALAEGALGAARGASDYLYVTVSTGIGGAVVIGGQLLLGPTGTAGELGHIPLELNGPPCGCGGRGHLEAIASGIAIARAGRAAVERGESPELEQIGARVGFSALEARHVAEAEAAGDRVATAIMARARHAFAVACVGLVNVFSPERIVVGGSLARAQGERWLAPAREEVARHAFRTPAARVHIVPAELRDDVGLVGALFLVEARGGDDGWRGRRPPIVGVTSTA